MMEKGGGMKKEQGGKGKGGDGDWEGRKKDVRSR